VGPGTEWLFLLLGTFYKERSYFSITTERAFFTRTTKRSTPSSGLVTRKEENPGNDDVLQHLDFLF